MYLDENKQAGFKMDSFTNVTLKPALLETAGAMNQSGSLPK